MVVNPVPLRQTWRAVTSYRLLTRILILRYFASFPPSTASRLGLGKAATFMPRQSPPSAPSETSSPSPASAVTAPTSFEAALTELEGIVARMESGELSLEDSLAAYKRGAELLQFCQATLKDAQQQVQILEAGLLQDFSDADRGD